jgi:hypothetical protein
MFISLANQAIVMVIFNIVKHKGEYGPTICVVHFFIPKIFFCMVVERRICGHLLNFLFSLGLAKGLPAMI